MVIRMQIQWAINNDIDIHNDDELARLLESIESSLRFKDAVWSVLDDDENIIKEF